MAPCADLMTFLYVSQDHETFILRKLARRACLGRELTLYANFLCLDISMRPESELGAIRRAGAAPVVVSKSQLALAPELGLGLGLGQGVG